MSIDLKNDPIFDPDDAPLDDAIVEPRSGPLVPKDAAETLRAQDAIRAAKRASMGATSKDRSRAFRNDFLGRVGLELELAHKWGASYDNKNCLSIREQYFRAKPNFWERLLLVRNPLARWLNSKKNSFGAPYLQYNLAPRGLIFNEGGRHFTLSITKWGRRVYFFGKSFTF